MSSYIARQLAVSVAFALTLTGCGTTRPPVTISPVALVYVSAATMPAQLPGDALRIDFYSSPELLSEEGYVLDDTRTCDAGNSIGVSGGAVAPFLGNASIRHPFSRRKVAAEWASGPDASVRPVYSTYLFVARPAYPATDQMPARSAYDLARKPQSICLSLSLREGYEFARTTNTLTFSAEQVAAALRGR